MEDVQSTDSDDPIQPRVHQAQLDLLRQKSSIVLAGNIATSAVLVWFLWSTVPSFPLLAWFSAHIVLSCVRLTIARSYDRQRQSSGLSANWSAVFTLCSAASGLLWGTLAVLFLAPDQVDRLILITIAIGGMCAAAFGALSVHAPSQYGFAITSVGVSIAALLTNGYTDIAALATVFLLADLVFTRLLNRSIARGIELQFENENLLSALQKEHRLAEQANRDKSDLLAAASHDLRQPVHAMGFFVEALEGQSMSPGAERLVARIKRSLWSLDGLFHSLLEMSRLEAGVIIPERGPILLDPILAALIEEYTPLARRRSLRLRRVPTQIAVESDPVLLERMLRNLVANAVRYTRTGGVIVGVRRRGARVAVEVCDTGAGMTKADCAAAFKAFRRLGRCPDELEPEDGLGLGLCIVGHLSRLLDHPIEIDSQPGRGSTFRIIAARTQPPARQQRAPLSVEKRISGLRVLVIDDDHDVCDALYAALKHWGCLVHLANTPNQASELAAVGPDVIIADYRLTRHTTGADVVCQIEHQLDRSIPALLITGDTAPERLVEARATGHWVLRKPVAPAQLRTALYKLLHDSGIGSPAT